MVDLDFYRQCLRGHQSQRLSADGLKAAAVLLPLFRRGGEDYLIFNRRTDHLKHHPGEIVFPGGSSHPEDNSLLETALRETDEEMGIKAADVELLGELDEAESIHGYRVAAFVGSIPYPYHYQINTDEIADVIELPIDALRDPSIFHVEQWQQRGRLHRIPFYELNGESIWGMTAMVLEQFLALTEQ